MNDKNGMATFPGVAVVWGMTVMAMIYAVGHVSGAHINPAVTVGFAISGRFPWKKASSFLLVICMARVGIALITIILRASFVYISSMPARRCRRTWWCRRLRRRRRA